MSWTIIILIESCLGFFYGARAAVRGTGLIVVGVGRKC